MSNAYTLPVFLAQMIGQSPLRDIMKKLLELTDEFEKGMGISMAYIMEIMHGLSYSMGGGHLSPFNWISDCFRGLKETSMDMYQVPEKLLATIEMITP